MNLAVAAVNQPIMNQTLEHFIQQIDVSSISDERKTILQPLIDSIQTKVNQKKAIRVNCVCTHNSRRSHFSQIWAQTMAHYFQVPNVTCYSAGTEATALFPKVVETLSKVGFEIHQLSEETNPIYSIQFSENEHPIIGFSKTLTDSFNPKTNFVAVMTCSHADENCPIITGAEQRIPITFEDPKVSDNTPQQNETYTARSLQIATEFYYIFSKIEQ